ncbi:2-(1,2-epoxy-1,2-dihydrophenyl)acetyl-CoA isomerase [Microbacterium resistens]|uniref:2-(1,2-epoxy-1,2-dihydrophenyl)acetyl-CoA isomerase n=1 Tax=Microbacterium resistens TaxID=156977 RepID=A0ABU1S8D5_9MICO|nr:enoyl-CoA hydratase/isomerase family protein [Microbacterium resistens]MDR6865815.1 2-(1,2-epoxy-1,2-dihydrophenyl)acetyl-CoA isomerase [Microbacterium resistens]
MTDATPDGHPVDDRPVRVDRDGAVAIVTLDAPDRRNALTTAAKTDLRDALVRIGADRSVRAVVLAAEGRAFSVGQDLAEHARVLPEGSETAFATVREHYTPIVRALLTMPKPVIAAVPGTCVGAGLGLALACDHRVFAAGAKLGTAFSGIGLTFDSGLSVTLPRAVGDARARELILFGRVFSAEEAVSWGISGEIVDGALVLDRAVELARLLAAGPTAAFAESKRLLLEAPALSLDAALAAEADAQTRCGATQDHTAAVAAFLARQPPVFRGE